MRRTRATWLNSRGFRTRNRQRSEVERTHGREAQPQKFTNETIQDMLTNAFYAGRVVRERRTKNGTATEREVREGLHVHAVSPDDFNRVQSILRARHRAPRSKTRQLRRYVS